MKVLAEQLPLFLEKLTEVPGVFFISGDEPLQMMEAQDAIRVWCDQQGFVERDLMVVDGQFEWHRLLESSNALSLFSEKKILDVRVAAKSPGKEGSKVLRDYLKNPPDDKVLILQTPKLDRNTRNSAWVKALEKAGVMIQVWELNPQQTMAWLSKRLQVNGFTATPDALRLLTERLEGNLLACAQEIEKMKLLFVDDTSKEQEQQHKRPMIQLEEKHILSLVQDSSRHSVFDFSNAVLAGNTQRVMHLYHQLQHEGQPLTLVLWALNDISTQLEAMAFELAQGSSEFSVLGKLPKFKQASYRPALGRVQQLVWSDVAQQKLKIDRMIKGVSEISVRQAERIWAEMLELALTLSGRSVIA